MTGRTELGGLADAYPVHFSEEEIVNYRHLLALQADTNIALQQLSSVFSIFDPTLVEAQEERFESSIASIQRNLESLNNEELEGQLTPLYDQLRQLGLSRDGVFLVLRSRLLLNDEQAVLLDLSRQQTSSLSSVVDELVVSAADSAAAGRRFVLAGDSHRRHPAVGDQRCQRNHRFADQLAFRWPGSAAPHQHAFGQNAAHGRRTA